MKIAQNLPQFKDTNAVLIVSGAQDAIFYAARNGTIAKKKRITVQTPTYSDNEGFFAARAASGRKGALRSGAVREADKWKPREQFMKETAKYLSELQKTYQIEQIFLFAPAYITKELVAHLPKKMQGSIVQTFKGEYEHEHPFELLEKIAETHKEPATPVSKEVQKILKRKA